MRQQRREVDHLSKHQPFLCRLACCKDQSQRRQLIKRAKPEQLKNIASVVYNTLAGRIDLKNHRGVRRHLLRHREKIRRFVNSCCSPTLRTDKVHIKPEGVARIRQLLGSKTSEQEGGILPALIPLLALLLKAALAGAVSAGTGLVVKKAITG
jgi:hypothetical protein